MRTLALLLAIAAIAGCATPALPTPTRPGGPLAGEPSFGAPVRIGGNVIFETTLAIRGDVLLACGNTDTGPEFVLGSLDGGGTWTRANFTRTAGPLSGIESSTDCDVEIGPDGTWYDALLSYPPVGVASASVAVGSSHDHGATWTFTEVPAPENVRADRPYLHVVDARTLYLTHKSHNEYPFSLWFQKSEDGGATWSTPALAASGKDSTFPNGNVGKMSVSPNGRTIRIPVHRFNTAALVAGMAEQEQLDLAESTDAGATWSTVPITAPLSLRADTFLPSLGATSAGRLYSMVAIANGSSAADLAFVTSTDGGATWTKPAVFASGQELASTLGTVSLDGGPNGTMDAAWFHWEGQTLIVSAARFDGTNVVWTREVARHASVPQGATLDGLEFLWLAHDAEGRIRVAYPLPTKESAAAPNDAIEYVAQP